MLPIILVGVGEGLLEIILQDARRRGLSFFIDGKVSVLLERELKRLDITQKM
jgi:hypothetical protein